MAPPRRITGRARTGSLMDSFIGMSSAAHHEQSKHATSPGVGRRARDAALRGAGEEPFLSGLDGPWLNSRDANVHAVVSDEVERRLVLYALRRCNDNQAHAAELLGPDRCSGLDCSTTGGPDAKT